MLSMQLVTVTVQGAMVADIAAAVRTAPHPFLYASVLQDSPQARKPVRETRYQKMSAFLCT
ncbi:hypothetical protein [Treponema paraluiscuniculi]|uniref:hypothetical protein n=1 Tax=Treponema paraluiscuniculi TaxID=53435 RepID=UPI002A35C210|nr:hypothetical protein [Treponema paraluiscuniculi]